MRLTKARRARLSDMRALTGQILAVILLVSCSKAAPVQENKLTTYTTQIDRQLIEIENLREAQEAKYKRPPINLVSEDSPDAVFLRRAYLDCIGRIPTADEARAFLADAAQDKRSKLIDKLLADPGWAQQRFQQLASLFRVQDEVLGVSQKPYIDWLRSAAEKNMPFDELVRTVLTASGNLKTNPPAGYLLRDHGWMPATTTESAWIFLGADLICAHCHDHPFADWTQMQVYQLAACFSATKITVGPLQSATTTRTPRQTPSPLFPGAKIVGGNSGRRSLTPPPPADANELWPASTRLQRALREKELGADEQLEITDVRGGAVLIPNDYKYRNASPGDRVGPDVLLFDRSEANNAIRQRIRIGPGDGRNLRGDFAEWLVTHEQFARTFAMRAWLNLFVEPRPQMGMEPPNDAISIASAEQSSMTNMLCNGGCGIGPAQQRTGFEIHPNDLAQQNLLRLLASIARETRFDAREMQRILMNTKAYQRTAITRPMGEALVFLPAPLLRRLSADQMWDSLVALGGEAEERRFTRDLPQTLSAAHSLRLLGRGAREWPDDDAASISFDLTRWMMNSQPVERAANVCGTRENGLDDLFLGILARPPSSAERAAAEKHLATEPDDLPSVAWALLNTGEFLFVQ